MNFRQYAQSLDLQAKLKIARIRKPCHDGITASSFESLVHFDYFAKNEYLYENWIRQMNLIFRNCFTDMI